MPTLPLHQSNPLPHQPSKNLERDYLHCDTCDLVFVPAEFHLDADAARARYLTHDNDPDNADYRRFLSRLWDELRPACPKERAASTTARAPAPHSPP